MEYVVSNSKEKRLVYDGEFPEYFRGVFLENGMLIGSWGKATKIIGEHMVKVVTADPNVPEKKPRKKKVVFCGKVVKKLLKKSGKTKKEMAKDLGISASNLSHNLGRDVRVSSFVKMVDALGYHIEIVEGKSDFIEEVKWRE